MELWLFEADTGEEVDVYRKVLVAAADNERACGTLGELIGWEQDVKDFTGRLIGTGEYVREGVIIADYHHG